MDLQFFIALNLMSISGLVMLIALVNSARGSLSWIAVNAAVVVAGLLALNFAWEWSGAIVAGVFVPLVLAPSVLSYIAQRRLLAGSAPAAAKYSMLAALLHPTPHSRFNASLLQALAHQGSDQKIRALDALTLRGTPQQKIVVAAMKALELAQWSDVLAIAQTSPEAATGLTSLQLRALGELGQIDEMVSLYQAAKTALSGVELQLGQLFLMAFSGRTSAVDLMFDHQLSQMDDEAKGYWKALAAFYSPEHSAAGRDLLAGIVRDALHSRTRSAAAHHLQASSPLARAPLAPSSVRTLDETQSRLVRARQFGDTRLSRLPATVALLAMNIVAFAVEEYRGGSEDLDVLVDLGALWPPLVWPGGEWWRLVSATFLHFGPVHLCANLFMLLLLGRVVETAFGWSKFLFIYIVGGLGSMACVMALMLSGTIQNGVLIGASGAIFAVFGSEAARQISCWRHSRDALDKRQLVNLALIILVQAVIDFSVPQISAAAHMSGFLIGLILGWLLNPSSNTASQRTALARQLP